jgi:transcriptional regulator with XRE-family HTH domain
MKTNLKYKFGEKLRSVRERRGLTLKEVAAKAGVSESLVSQIERNKVSPSIDTLLQIADVLDIDYEHLFSDYHQKRKVAIVRSADRGSIHRNKVIIHQLSAARDISKDPGVEAFLFEIEPEGETGNREYGHSGWELGIIIEGRAELQYGNETYLLNPGDTIAFPSDIPHVFKNNGLEPLKAIWVVTPSRNLFQS